MWLSSGVHIPNNIYQTLTANLYSPSSLTTMKLLERLEKQHLLRLRLLLHSTTRSQNLVGSTSPLEQGLTLIESLVAVVMIGVAISATLPPLFVATATRVQNRRVEQAMQLAQGEVDRVRTLVEQTQETNVDLLPQNAATLNDGDPAQDYEAAINVATDRLISPNPSTQCYKPYMVKVDPFNPNSAEVPAFPAADTLIPVDIDGQTDDNGACDAEFLMQVFRVDAPNTQPGTYFELGVRVYAISAENYMNDLETQEASLKFTTATGAQNIRPLATLYTNVTKADRQNNSLCPFHDLVGCP
ncbi:MAG: prepilin-type N-terminal cleavage/methylation domain-containing protein [Leptolyngbyaceae cyanobacterium]